MKKQILKISAVFLPLVAIVFLFLSPVQTKAQTAIEVERCNKFAAYFGLNGENFVDSLPKFCSLSALLARVLEILLYLSGTVTVLFLILGGFYYLTAAGNDEQLEKGKKILINSVIGLIVIIMATAIVRVVSVSLRGSGTTTTSNSSQ